MKYLILLLPILSGCYTDDYQQVISKSFYSGCLNGRSGTGIKLVDADKYCLERTEWMKKEVWGKDCH